MIGAGVVSSGSFRSAAERDKWDLRFFFLIHIHFHCGVSAQLESFRDSYPFL
jgi:hypothetical protein